MAKQTFTTGSVLTATQMNNLQANDYNWTVSQKTASYVLVAADAGTRIEMNSGSATTITVNTGLFAAGDTLFIQNIGSGACTVTAGTATVNKATAGSLTLSQYQGGTLYFVSASSAIFFADAGYTPPLTTKGDLFGYDTAAARIPIGSNNQVLTADSTQALGLKWATPASGGWTSIASGSLSGNSVSITSIPNTYYQLALFMDNPVGNPNYGNITITLNGDTGTVYAGTTSGFNNPLWTTTYPILQYSTSNSTANSYANVTVFFPNYATTSSYKIGSVASGGTNGGVSGNTYAYLGQGTFAYKSTSAISSIQMIPQNTPWNAGTYTLYGIK